MKGNMDIYIDFDSTLNNLDKVWIDEINSYIGMEYSVLNIETWDWFYKKFTKKLADLTLRNIYLKSKPLEGALEFIIKCKEIGNVKILTSTHNNNPTFIEKKNEHIRAMFGDVEIIHESNKFIYANKNSILIDDSLDNVHKFVNSGGRAIAFSNNYTHVYNKRIIEHNNCVRLHFYEEIIKHLKTFEKELEKKLTDLLISVGNSHTNNNKPKLTSYEKQIKEKESFYIDEVYDICLYENDPLLGIVGDVIHDRSIIDTDQRDNDIDYSKIPIYIIKVSEIFIDEDEDKMINGLKEVIVNIHKKNKKNNDIIKNSIIDTINKKGYYFQLLKNIAKELIKKERNNNGV